MRGMNSDEESDRAIDLSVRGPGVPTVPSDKPNVKPAREAVKNLILQATTSHPSTSHPSTSHSSTSQPSTSKASKSSKSKASKSKASKSKASKSKASKSKASTSKTSTSKASTSKASTSKSSTSKASTSKTSTSKAPTLEASTSTASKSKESTPKATRKARSTAISSEVQEEAGQNLPSGKNPSASTSASTSAVSSSNKCKDSQFWLETIQSKFTSSAYKDLLRESSFTEPQAGIIQNVFHRAARRMYNNVVNSDRVKKTHKCQECVFSVSHQCVSIDYLHVGWLTGDPTIPTIIEPQKTIICVCHFAFFHAHTPMPSQSMTEKTANSELTQPVREVDRRTTSLRCVFCDTIVMIEHPFVQNADCTLTKWSAIKSNNEKTFHAQVTDDLKDFTPKPPSLEEFYTCSNHCCLYFHRCTE